MLSRFNLKPGIDPEAFEQAYTAFVAHMRERDVLVGSGPLGRRRQDTPLDTDAELHAYFTLMRFRDRAQSEASYALIAAHEAPTKASHLAVWTKASDMVFTCWEDAEAPIDCT